MSRPGRVPPAGRSAQSPLRDVVPGPARWAGAVAAGLVVLGLGVVGGLAAERSALLGAAVAVTVLAVRVAADEQPWPQAPARRTRPGWPGVATTLRQLEGARTDTGDRSALRLRLARLEHDGAHPAAAAVREALPAATRRPSSRPSTRRPLRGRSGTARRRARTSPKSTGAPRPPTPRSDA